MKKLVVMSAAKVGGLCKTRINGMCTMERVSIVDVCMLDPAVRSGGDECAVQQYFEFGRANRLQARRWNSEQST